MERRRFLALSAPAVLFGAVRAPPALSVGVWASCRSDPRGGHFLTAFDDTDRVRFDIPLPARGHGIAFRPAGRECAVFARRPGTFLWVADIGEGRVLHRIESPQNRHYYGHGVFDPKGRLLYVTENDFETGIGVIGVYDAGDGYRRLGELPSHGVGPHELKLMGDGRTLVIANGGIRTHPDLGRSKLNLADMDPSLAYVDTADGRLLAAYRPPAD